MDRAEWNRRRAERRRMEDNGWAPWRRRGSFVEYGDTPRQRTFWRTMDFVVPFLFLAVLGVLAALEWLADDPLPFASWVADHVG